MDLGEFLTGLLATGRAQVDRDIGDVEPGNVDAVLAELDAAVRTEGPGGLPPLDPIAARWGVAMLYRALTLLVHRDLGVEAVDAFAAMACPTPLAAPATHHAVDLTLRHLPEVIDLARGRAPADPLLDALRRLGGLFPLSSVGVAGVVVVDATPLLANRGLLRSYLDRILQRADVTRLDDERIRHALRVALGEHTTLAAPEVRARLESLEQPEQA